MHKSTKVIELPDSLKPIAAGIVETASFWELMATGRYVRCPEHIYMAAQENSYPGHFEPGRGLFALADPYRFAPDGEPIHAFFWQNDLKQTWARYETLNTRKGLDEL